LRYRKSLYSDNAYNDKALTLKTAEIVVRRSITSKLEAAFSAELGVLPKDMRHVLLDDMATAVIERMKVLRTISKLESYPIQASD
jgi:hypothetical protein